MDMGWSPDDFMPMTNLDGGIGNNLVSYKYKLPISHSLVY